MTDTTSVRPLKPIATFKCADPEFGVLKSPFAAPYKSSQILAQRAAQSGEQLGL